MHPPRAAEPPLRPALRSPRLADAIAQQAVWWMAVLAVRAELQPVAALPALLLVLAHGLLRGRAWPLLSAMAAAAYGLLADSALLCLGYLSFGAEGGALSPPWMVGLWAAFGAGLTCSLSWLGTLRLLPAAALAGAAGALAYRGGAGLAVLEIRGGLEAWLAVALAWAVGVPLLARSARHLGAGR